MLRTLTSVIDILTAMHHLVWRAARSHALAPHAEPYAPQRARPELHFQQHTKHTQKSSCTWHCTCSTQLSPRPRSQARCSFDDLLGLRLLPRPAAILAAATSGTKATKPDSPPALHHSHHFRHPRHSPRSTHPRRSTHSRSTRSTPDRSRRDLAADTSSAPSPLDELRRRHSQPSRTRELGTHLFSLSLLPLPLSHSLSHARTHTHSLSLTLSLPPTHSLPLTPSPTHSLSHQRLIHKSTTI